MRGPGQRPERPLLRPPVPACKLQIGTGLRSHRLLLDVFGSPKQHTLTSGARSTLKCSWVIFLLKEEMLWRGQEQRGEAGLAAAGLHGAISHAENFSQPPSLANFCHA